MCNTGYNLRHGMARHIRWWEGSISRDAQTLSTRGGEISRIAQTNSTSRGPISRARGYFSCGTALSGVSQLLPVTAETPAASKRSRLSPWSTHAGKDNEGPSTHLALCRLTYIAGTLSPWKLKEPSGTKEEQTQTSAADVLDLDEDSASLVHNAIQEMIDHRVTTKAKMHRSQ
ncbi:hypothetical protein Bbelb_415890 [Branchiostoma belcheri]|nr:hypothetical protein Bbelb_415890 [Branchiostoma belcheri]